MDSSLRHTPFTDRKNFLKGPVEQMSSAKPLLFSTEKTPIIKPRGVQIRNDEIMSSEENKFGQIDEETPQFKDIQNSQEITLRNRINSESSDEDEITIPVLHEDDEMVESYASMANITIERQDSSDSDIKIDQIWIPQDNLACFGNLPELGKELEDQLAIMTSELDLYEL